MTINELEKAIKENNLSSIYLLHGKETYLLENNVKKIKKSFGELKEGLNYIKIDDAINSNVKMITGSKEATIHQFIRLDIKNNYKKSKKYKVKNKRPHLNDKAVVYKVTPYEANFSTKKKYYDNGSIMTSKELDNKIKQPQRAGDYRYFVYVYPVYKYYGKYDKGTKAYTETYYIQVTDLKKKVTYKPVKVATAKPEKKVSYSGTVPKKHSGTVKSSKIDKAIKKLG